MNKLISRIFIGSFILIVALVLFLGGMGHGPSLSQAELTTDRYETLSGSTLSTATGNATGALTGIQLYKGNEFPEAFSCYASVTNASNVAVVNTATFNIEGSLDNLKWGILQTTAISASSVATIKNTAAPPARYYRVNVTAIQNASSTYVGVGCLFD